MILANDLQSDQLWLGLSAAECKGMGNHVVQNSDEYQAVKPVLGTSICQAVRGLRSDRPGAAADRWRFPAISLENRMIRYTSALGIRFWAVAG